MEYYQKAAALRDPLAMHNIGWLYKEGLGVKKDYKQALVWFTKATNGGDAKTISKAKKEIKEIGYQYLENREPSEARKCFELTQNHFAWFDLGKLYEKQKKYDHAWECYEKADTLGNYYAKDALKRLSKRK